MNHKINESAARQAHEANSFREFQEGRATAEYQQMVDSAKEIAKAQKKAVDPMYHDKIDSLLASYCSKLAVNLNKGYEIAGRVPSVMIAGFSNYPNRKKAKQLEAHDRNMREYISLEEILHKIQGVGMGGISGDDPNALEKLIAKLEDLQEKQSFMKKANAYWRKHGTMKGYPHMPHETASEIDEKMKTEYPWVQKNGPYADFKLNNNSAEIRRLKKRLDSMARLAESPLEGWEFEGGKVVINREANRVQILFDDKPREEIRTELKRNAFKWSPKQGVWQRQLTDNAVYSTRRIRAIAKLE